MQDIKITDIYSIFRGRHDQDSQLCSANRWTIRVSAASRRRGIVVSMRSRSLLYRRSVYIYLYINVLRSKQFFYILNIWKRTPH